MDNSKTTLAKRSEIIAFFFFFFVECNADSYVCNYMYMRIFMLLNKILWFNSFDAEVLFDSISKNDEDVPI